MKNILRGWLRPRKAFSYLTPHLLIGALIPSIPFIASPVTAEIAKFEVTAHVNAVALGGATNELFNLHYSYDNAAVPTSTIPPYRATYRPITGFFTLGSDRVDFDAYLMINNDDPNPVIHDHYTLEAGPFLNTFVTGLINGVNVTRFGFSAIDRSVPHDFLNSTTLPLSAAFFDQADSVYLEIHTSKNVMNVWAVDIINVYTITSWTPVTPEPLPDKGLTPKKGLKPKRGTRFRATPR